MVEAVPIRRSTSPRSRSEMPSRWRRGSAGGGSLGSSGAARRWTVSVIVSSSEQHDAVAVVRLVELDADALGERGGNVLADVVRPDRQLSVAPVDEDGELHARGAAVLEQGVDRGADRSTREENVVDEHDGLALEREVQLGAPDDGLRVERRPAAADEHVV